MPATLIFYSVSIALLQLYQRQPRLLATILLILLLGVLASVLHAYLAQAQTERQLTRYGQALAESGALRAVEPALAQDMVSLQAILQSLTRQPGVVGATIHDVENHLWVQSGVAASDAQRRFAAPITLDTHIAGYLTLSLDNSENSHLPLFLGVWWGLLALILAGLWGRVWQLANRPAAQPEDDEAEESAEEMAEEIFAVQIHLCVNNLAALQQQLSQEHLAERLARLDRQLTGVLALYAGQRQRLDGQALLLRVCGDTSAQATFYALCICQLLLLLNVESGNPRLQLSAAIMPEQEAPASVEQLMQIAPPPTVPSSIVVAVPLLEPALEQQAQLDKAGQLQAIKAPYQALLQRQQQQLAHL